MLTKLNVCIVQSDIHLVVIGGGSARNSENTFCNKNELWLRLRFVGVALIIFLQVKNIRTRSLNPPHS